MPSSQLSVSKYRDSLIKILSFSSASNLHFALLIRPLRHCLLFMTGMLLPFSAITRTVFSVLALWKSEKIFLAILYDSLNNSEPLLLARYEAHILCCTVQAKRLGTATKSPVINSNFLWMLNILMSSSVPHVWLFLHWILKHQPSLCRNVATELCKDWRIAFTVR